MDDEPLLAFLRRCSLEIAGLSFLWLSLHASPYYPFSLSPAFPVESLDVITAKHLLYSMILALFFAVSILARGRADHVQQRYRLFAAGIGAAGVIGSLLIAFSHDTSEVAALVDGIALSLVALYVAAVSIGWFTVVSLRDTCDLIGIFGLSCVGAAILWSVALAVGGWLTTILLVSAPAASAAFLASAHVEFRSPSLTTVSSLFALPWSIVGLCLAFVYFGVMGVRAFTAMEQGAPLAGSLGAIPQVVAALTCAGLSCASIVYLEKRKASFSAFVSAFALLALVYMAALLTVVVGETASSTALMGKRVLVGAEHAFEVLLVIVLATNVSSRGLSAALVFGLFGIVVIVAPQFIALDVMYRSGVLDTLASLSLVTPIAAVAAFFVAAGSIVMLVSFSSKVAADATRGVEDAFEAMCREATKGAGLTPREFDVLVCTCRGYSAKKSAEVLLVSESTVKAHLTHIYQKLGVHSKQELIARMESLRVR